MSLLTHKDLDAVSICTLSGAHLHPCLASSEAGKHVVYEKPLEVSVERIDKMINECDKSGVLLSGTFPRRFNQSTKKLNKASQENRFGTITMADAYVKC